MSGSAPRPVPAAIRSATPADVPRIVEMVGHFIAASRYAQVYSVDPAALTRLTAQVQATGVLLVAEAGGQVVGVLAAFPILDPVCEQPMLDELVWWVEPAYRRGTLGPRLLRALEQIARQVGIGVVKMIAPYGSDVGRFYERMGYEAVETSYVRRLTHGTDVVAEGRDPGTARQGPEPAARPAPDGAAADCAAAGR